MTFMHTLPLEVYAELMSALERLVRVPHSISTRRALQLVDEVWAAYSVFTSNDFNNIESWRSAHDAWSELARWQRDHVDFVQPQQLERAAVQELREITKVFRARVEDAIGQHLVFVPSLAPQSRLSADQLLDNMKNSMGIDSDRFADLPVLGQHLFESAAAAVAYGEGTLAATAALEASEATLRMFCRHYGMHVSIGIDGGRWDWSRMLDQCRRVYNGRTPLRDEWTIKTLGELRKEERNLVAHGRKEYSPEEAISTLRRCANAVGGLLRTMEADDTLALSIALPEMPDLDRTYAVYLLARSPQENGRVAARIESMIDVCWIGEFKIGQDDRGDRICCARQVAQMLQIEPLVESVLRYIQHPDHWKRPVMSRSDEYEYSLEGVCFGYHLKHRQPSGAWLSDVSALFDAIPSNAEVAWLDRIGLEQGEVFTEAIRLAQEDRKQRESERQREDEKKVQGDAVTLSA
jgi:hypothetical protein